MEENKVEIYTTKEEAGRREKQIKESANALGLDWVEHIKGPEEIEIFVGNRKNCVAAFTIRTVESEETKVERLRNKLYEKCGDEDKAGLETLIRYYIDRLGWTEYEALKYTIELVEDGTIEQIKRIGGSEK